VAVVAALPVVGVIAYLLLGETNIGRRNRNSMDKAMEELPQPTAMDDPVAQVPPNNAHLFRVGASISGFQPVAGNHAELMADSNATIEHMAAASG
jgi:cardiolipin synthase